MRLPFAGPPWQLGKRDSQAVGEAPWTLIGQSSEHLLVRLEELYWAGVERELVNAAFTLRTWQYGSLADINLDDESDNFLHGFDTFIDQVDENSHKFAEYVGAVKTGNSTAGNSDNYNAILARRTRELLLKQRGNQLKSEIRTRLEQHQPNGGQQQQRARMLLQAIGLLDIETMVENRSRLEDVSLARRPAFPQLQLDTYSKDGIPRLRPLRCFFCDDIIKSSMYTRNLGQAKTPQCICENCYHEKFVGNPEFAKTYKHSILDEIITPSISRKICTCPATSQHSISGSPIGLYPTRKNHRHQQACTARAAACGLLTLGDVVTAAKYEGMQSITNCKRQGKKWWREREQRNPNLDFLDRNPTIDSASEPRLKHLQHISQEAPSRASIATTLPPGEINGLIDDIPPFLEQFVEEGSERNPHTALRIGPIVIRRGDSSSKEGIIVTSMNRVVTLFNKPLTELGCLALTKSGQLWLQQQPATIQKPFKAITKQVVGLPFTGVLDPQLEASIIDGLVAVSKHGFDDPVLEESERVKLLKSVLRPTMEGLRALVGQHLSVYLKSVADQIIRFRIRWESTNHCENLCDALIDYELFGPLVSNKRVVDNTKNEQPVRPLYLMSFVCRAGHHIKPNVRSKFDVPRGFMEDYFLRLRCGRHDESDVIDALQEYWYDWGAFGKHLYKYQDIFPWDCTEAFGRYPVSCGDCNLAKHVWAFPFDSWSILSLHLTRDRYGYPPESKATPMSEAMWMKNRLLVICAQEKLTRVAVALAQHPLFAQGTEWLHRQSDPALDRLKLGGVHRAQPFSHTYDHGRYRNYFVAPWVHLTHEQRVEEYEAHREARVKLPDVEYISRLFSGKDVDEVLQDFSNGPQDAGPATRVHDVMMWLEETRIKKLNRTNGVGDDRHEVGGGSDAACASNCGTGCGAIYGGGASHGDASSGGGYGSGIAINSGGGDGGGGGGGGECGSSSGGGGGGCGDDSGL